MPNRHQIALAGTALSFGAAALLIPAGAGAGSRPSRQPAVTWTINGARSDPPVFVRCGPSGTTGSPLPRNVVATRATRGVRGTRVTISFASDPTRRIIVLGGGSTPLPTALRLPCSGTGQVRYRAEQVLRVRARVVRRIRGRRRVTFVTNTVVNLLESSTAPVVFVQTAS